MWGDGVWVPWQTLSKSLTLAHPKSNLTSEPHNTSVSISGKFNENPCNFQNTWPSIPSASEKRCVFTRCQDGARKLWQSSPED